MNDGSLPNQGRQGFQPWTWMECCDLCCAVRSISAHQGDNNYDEHEVINWAFVRDNAPILRMTRRTLQQIKKKWNNGSANTDLKNKMNDYFNAQHPWM